MGSCVFTEVEVDGENVSMARQKCCDLSTSWGMLVVLTSLILALTLLKTVGWGQIFTDVEWFESQQGSKVNSSSSPLGKEKVFTRPDTGPSRWPLKIWVLLLEVPLIHT